MTLHGMELWAGVVWLVCVCVCGSKRSREEITCQLARSLISSAICCFMWKQSLVEKPYVESNRRNKLCSDGYSAAAWTSAQRQQLLELSPPLLGDFPSFLTVCIWPPPTTTTSSCLHSSMFTGNKGKLQVHDTVLLHTELQLSLCHYINSCLLLSTSCVCCALLLLPLSLPQLGSVIVRWDGLKMKHPGRFLCTFMCKYLKYEVGDTRKMLIL